MPLSHLRVNGNLVSTMDSRHIKVSILDSLELLLVEEALELLVLAEVKEVEPMMSLPPHRVHTLVQVLVHPQLRVRGEVALLVVVSLLVQDAACSRVLTVDLTLDQDLADGVASVAPELVECRLSDSQDAHLVTLDNLDVVYLLTRGAVQHHLEWLFGPCPLHFIQAILAIVYGTHPCACNDLK